MKIGKKLLAIIAITAVILFACGNGDCTHTWEWEVTKAATEMGDGVKTETCSNCSETRNTEAILASGLVQIPGETFTMGPDISNYDAEFNVTLSAFKMSKYAVTQDLYQAVMGNNPSYFNGGPTGVEDDLPREPAEGETQGRRPVETVTWFDAVEFCNKLSTREGFTPVYTITERTPATGYPITAAAVTADWTASGYRLPTEAQWEYACRAGTTTNWYFGDDETKLEEHAWYITNANYMTHEVGKKTPNAYSLYDMLGNVWEWCWDWMGEYPTTAKTDYTGAESGTFRTRRGGGWLSNDTSYTHSAFRSNGNPVSGDDGIGFRVVRP